MVSNNKYLKYFESIVCIEGVASSLEFSTCRDFHKFLYTSYRNVKIVIRGGRLSDHCKLSMDKLEEFDLDFVVDL